MWYKPWIRAFVLWGDDVIEEEVKKSLSHKTQCFEGEIMCHRELDRYEGMLSCGPRGFAFTVMWETRCLLPPVISLMTSLLDGGGKYGKWIFEVLKNIQDRDSKHQLPLKYFGEVKAPGWQRGSSSSWPLCQHGPVEVGYCRHQMLVLCTWTTVDFKQSCQS